MDVYILPLVENAYSPHNEIWFLLAFPQNICITVYSNIAAAQVRGRRLQPRYEVGKGTAAQVGGGERGLQPR